MNLIFCVLSICIRSIIHSDEKSFMKILNCKWRKCVIAILTESENPLAWLQRLTFAFTFHVAGEMRPRCWSWDHPVGCESSWAHIRNRLRKSKDHSRQDHHPRASSPPSYYSLNRAEHERHYRIEPGLSKENKFEQQRNKTGEKRLTKKAESLDQEWKRRREKEKRKTKETIKNEKENAHTIVTRRGVGFSVLGRKQGGKVGEKDAVKIWLSVDALSISFSRFHFALFPR